MGVHSHYPVDGNQAFEGAARARCAITLFRVTPRSKNSPRRSTCNPFRIATASSAKPSVHWRACLRSSLCAGTHSALSQQSKASLPIGRDLRNGAGSNLAKAPVNNSRTPMEVTNGVATVIGHYPESSKLRIVIGLTPPKMAEEEEFLKELQDQKSPNFHKWLTPEQWNTRFAPAPEDEQAVADWAKSQGLTVTQRYPNRLIVDVEGTSGSIEKAFGVTINNYLLKGVTEFSNDRDPVIPASLGSIIQSVGGLNSVQRAHAQHEGNAAQLFKSYAEGDVVSTGTSIKHDGDHAAFEAALKASDAKKGSSTKLKSAAQNGPVDPSVTDGLD